MEDQPESRPWRRLLSKYALNIVLLGAVSSSIIIGLQTRQSTQRFGRELETIEKTLENNESKRAADSASQNLEVVKQIKERLKQVKEKLRKSKLSDSEIRDIVASLKEILKTIKSIVKLGCSSVVEEKKSEWQMTLDKLNDELERLNDAPASADTEGRRQNLVEKAKNLEDLVELIRKLCFLLQLGNEPMTSSEIGESGPGVRLCDSKSKPLMKSRSASEPRSTSQNRKPDLHLASLVRRGLNEIAPPSQLNRSVASNVRNKESSQSKQSKKELK